MEILLYDYETLGKDVRTCPIISIAALTIDTDNFIDNPYNYSSLVDKSLYAKFDVSEQVKKYGMTIEKETVFWWEKQSEEARFAIKPATSDVSIEELDPFLRAAVAQASKKSDLQVFTRGNTFDPMITQFMFDRLKRDVPYGWWTVRDVRSFIDGLTWGSDINNSFIPEGLDKLFVAHDPRHDIAMDAMRMQTIIQALGE
jgi:hypothetical protein